jgi:hypothetical protein
MARISNKHLVSRIISKSLCELLSLRLVYWFLNHSNLAYLPKASPLTALLLRLSDLSKITPFPISFSPDETSKPSRKKKIASDLGIWIMVRRIGALDQRLWIC